MVEGKEIRERQKSDNKGEKMIVEGREVRQKEEGNDKGELAMLKRRKPWRGKKKT